MKIPWKVSHQGFSFISHMRAAWLPSSMVITVLPEEGFFNRSKSEDVTWSCYTPICAVVLFKNVLNKTIQFSYYIRLTSLFLFWASLADRLGATSSAFGSGCFDHGCETGTFKQNNTVQLLQFPSTFDEWREHGKSYHHGLQKGPLFC